MRLGLVTYMWGAAWDVPTLIKNCRETGFEGVELRTEHAHGVEPTLGPEERKEVARRFVDGGVELVGLGTVCEFHSADKAELDRNIESAKRWIVLAHDVGAGGIKVRPNGLPAGVPVERTLVQIGESLQTVAQFGEGYGVEIRLEVHGRGTSELPRIRRIMDVATHPGVGVCWNCNETDLAGDGLEANFELVKNRLGRTVHIHDLVGKYPWEDFFALLKTAQYEGWTLLEEGNPTADPIRVMKYYRMVWRNFTQ